MATRKTSSAKKVSTMSVEELLKEESEFKPSMEPLTRETISEEELEFESLVPTLEPTDIMGMKMVSEEQLLEPDIELTKRIMETSEFQPLPSSEVESWNQDVEASLMEPDIESVDRTTETLGFQPLPISEVGSWSQDVEVLSVSEIVTTVETWFLDVEGSMFDPEGLVPDQ